MNVQSLIILALTILLSLVRYAAIPHRIGADASSIHLPRFVALLGTDQHSRVTIELGMVNREAGPLEPLDDLHGVWQLLDSAGNLRASGTLGHLPHLAPGEATFPVRWTAELEDGLYTLVWGCSQTGMKQIGFQVLQRSGKAAIILDHPKGIQP